MYDVKSIVPFNMVIDTDMGLYKLIQSQYQSNIFRKSMMDQRDMDIMKLILTDREHYNFLSDLIIDEKYIQDADDLYDQYMDRKYGEILNLSCTTGIFDIIRRTKFVGDYLKFTIYYFKDIEKEFLESKYKKYDFIPTMIKCNSIEELDVKEYGSIYVKNYEDILRFKDIDGKNVIYANYRFNCEDGIPDLPLANVTEQIILTNAIKNIDLYPRPNIIG